MAQRSDGRVLLSQLAPQPVLLDPADTHALVVLIPPRRGDDVEANREAEGAEEDGGHVNRVTAEEDVVDLLEGEECNGGQDVDSTFNRPWHAVCKWSAGRTTGQGG